MNSMVSLQQNVSNQFTFADAAKGIELSGGHHYGGYHYSVAVFDENTTGIDQSSNTSPYVPSATGGANGGVGFGSSSSFKTIYGRARLPLQSGARFRKPARHSGGRRDRTPRSHVSELRLLLPVRKIAPAIPGRHRGG